MDSRGSILMDWLDGVLGFPVAERGFYEHVRMIPGIIHREPFLDYYWTIGLCYCVSYISMANDEGDEDAFWSHALYTRWCDLFITIEPLNNAYPEDERLSGRRSLDDWGIHHVLAEQEKRYDGRYRRRNQIAPWLWSITLPSLGLKFPQNGPSINGWAKLPTCAKSARSLVAVRIIVHEKPEKKNFWASMNRQIEWPSNAIVLKNAKTYACENLFLDLDWDPWRDYRLV